MADTKISQLPVATTPLTGAELVPIVQGSVTDQTTIDNLTAGRAVSAASLNVTGSTAPTVGLCAPAAGAQLGVVVGGAYALKWDASGHSGSGIAPTSTALYYTFRTLTQDTTTPDTYGHLITLTASVGVGAASMRGLHTSLGTAAGANTLPNLYHMAASQGSIGAPVTSQYGYFVDPTMIGATNNFAFVGAIPSGTNRWNTYNQGTANNANLGNSSFGKLTVPTCAVDTTSFGTSLVTNTAATYTVLTTDGTIVQTTAASTYTLPAAASFPGRKLHLLTQFAGTVISASSNVVPIAGGSAGTAILAATAGKYALLQSNGTNWLIVAAN